MRVNEASSLSQEDVGLIKKFLSSSDESLFGQMSCYLYPASIPLFSTMDAIRREIM